MSVYFPSKYRCPTCGGAVSEMPDCPGYPRYEQQPDGSKIRKVMVCYPFCGNATHFSCDDRAGCGWWWREENNRSMYEWNFRIQREVEMGPRPDWLGAWIQENEPTEDDDDADDALDENDD